MKLFQSNKFRERVGGGGTIPKRGCWGAGEQRGEKNKDPGVQMGV